MWVIVAVNTSLRIGEDVDFDRLPDLDPGDIRFVDVGQHPHLREVGNDEERIGIILANVLTRTNFARGNGPGQRGRHRE